MDKGMTKQFKTLPLTKGDETLELSETKRLVFFGGIIIIIAMAVVTIILVNQINSLTGIAQQIYLHPLTVSRATLKIHGAIDRMEAIVANAISVEKEEDIINPASEIVQLESMVQKNLDVIEERFLGDKAYVVAIREVFVDWSENCNQILRLARDGKQNEAATLNQKKIAPLATDLKTRINFFTDFAEKKATEFRDKSEILHHNTLAVIFGTMVVGIMISGLIGLFIILKLSKANARLLASEERSRKIVENALDAIISIDDQGIVTQFNPAAEKVFGYCCSHVLGKTIPDLLMPKGGQNEHQEAVPYYIHLAQGAGIKEVNGKRADGTEFPAEISVSNIRTSTGNLYTAHIKDISERKAAMIQLVMSELRTRRVIDHITDGVLVVDLKGIVCFANPGAISLLGLSEDTIIGHEFGVPLGHGGVMEVELLGKKKVIAEMRTDHFQWEGQSATIISLRDVTDRKEVDRERLRVQKMDSLGSLAGGVAHDINNMLLPILNLTSMVANKLEEGSPERKKLDMVLKAAQRMKDMAAGILAFSREDKDEVSEIDLFEVFSNTVELMGSTVPATIRLNSSLDPTTGKVRASRERLEAILMNLYSNAVYAMEGHPGELSLSLTSTVVGAKRPAKLSSLTPGWYAKLTVTDTGCGMDAETLEKIYEPFFTTKSIGVGTGLGLAMVFGTVEKYGGAVDVISALGEGTTFTIYLPLLKVIL